MGYYASGYGSVTAKDKSSADAITKLLEDSEQFLFSGWPNSLYDQPLVITIQQDDDKYHEDEVYDFLHSIEDYITEGLIEYTGEDDYHWAFKFKPDIREWRELSGEIIYELAELTDDELKYELQNRGYVITKKEPDPNCSLFDLLAT